MIYLIYGEDDFRSKQKLKELITDFTNKFGGENIDILETDQITPEKISRTLLTPSMFSPQKMVVTKNFLNQSKASLDLFSISSLPKEITLVFWEEGEISPAKELAGAKVFEFKKLWGKDLEKWYLESFQKEGLEVDKEALIKIITLIENNLWKANSEIQKIAAFKKSEGSTRVDSKDISLLVKSDFDYSIFELTDALGQKNTKKSLNLLNNFLAKGEEPLGILGMIHRQIRNLVLLKEAQAKKLPDTKIATLMKLHPFVIKKTKEQIKNFSLKELRTIYDLLVKTDQQIKIGECDPALALRQLVLDICSFS